MLEKRLRKPSMCAHFQSFMCAHFQSLRSANSGRLPSSQQVRIICRTWRSTARRGSGRACPVPPQAVHWSGVPWHGQGHAASLAGAAEQGAVESTGGVGGLGGVLGHVGGDRVIGQFGVGAECGDLAHVELFTPGEFAFPDRSRDDVDRDAGGGGPDGVGEHGDSGGRGRGLSAAVRAVEADHGVEVDQAALLVLGDLGEGHAQHRAPPSGSGQAGRRSHSAGRS